MSEKMPPLYEQPNWQDITLDSIHEKIGNNKLQEARQLTNVRLDALRGAVVDIERLLAQPDSGEITDESWGKEKQLLLDEIEELQKILDTLDNQPELE